MVLPEISCGQDYRNIYADTAVWLPAAQTICVRHGLDAQALRRVKDFLARHPVPDGVSFYRALWGDL